MSKNCKGRSIDGKLIFLLKILNYAFVKYLAKRVVGDNGY